eukprot:TRINITY_DN111197_c0_g1_i1.p1 TRINITY_DN111197_c0_g1~~TRINITY_DN111197_c0_g1_i1.p1  ORF type:complete len:715 (+),score=178.78 TRINITY_DN111197_c0_g1_i1:35-2179(+)
MAEVFEFQVPECPAGEPLKIKAPDGAQLSIPLPDVVLKGDTLRLEKKDGGWVFSGIFRDDGGAEDGQPAGEQPQAVSNGVGAAHADGARKSQWQLTQDLSAPETVQVQVRTTKGPLYIKIVPSWAPHGSQRFLKLVEDGYFNDVAIYRAVPKFLIQFGVVNRSVRYEEIPDDKLVGVPVENGSVLFSSRGPNTRDTTICIFLNDMPHMGVEYDWETPIGKVTPESMDTLSQIYTGYGDIPQCGGSGPDPHELEERGNDYVRQKFPKCDFVMGASRVERVLGVFNQETQSPGDTWFELRDKERGVFYCNDRTGETCDSLPAALGGTGKPAAAPQPAAPQPAAVAPAPQLQQAAAAPAPAARPAAADPLLKSVSAIDASNFVAKATGARQTVKPPARELPVFVTDATSNIVMGIDGLPIAIVNAVVEDEAVAVPAPAPAPVQQVPQEAARPQAAAPVERQSPGRPKASVSYGAPAAPEAVQKPAQPQQQQPLQQPSQQQQPQQPQQEDGEGPQPVDPSLLDGNAVVKLELGSWKVYEDGNGEFYVNTATGLTYIDPPPELVELYRRVIGDGSQRSEEEQARAQAYAEGEQRKVQEMQQRQQQQDLQQQQLQQQQQRQLMQSQVVQPTPAPQRQFVRAAPGTTTSVQVQPQPYPGAPVQHVISAGQPQIVAGGQAQMVYGAGPHGHYPRYASMAPQPLPSTVQQVVMPNQYLLPQRR